MKEDSFSEASSSGKTSDGGRPRGRGRSGTGTKGDFISPEAKIASDVKLGRDVIIGPDVTIAGGCVLGDCVEIRGITYIGRDNFISQGALLGMPPQDLGYNDEPTGLILGESNFIGPRVTIHRGTPSEEKSGYTDIGNAIFGNNDVEITEEFKAAAGRMKGLTKVGNKNTFKAFVHIAHDCLLGCDNALDEYVQLSGHVEIDSGCRIGTLSGIHQFVRMGRLARVEAHTKVTKDVPPFFKVGGHPAEILDPVPEEELKNHEVREIENFAQIVRACRLLSSEGLNTSQAVEKMTAEMSGPKIEELIEFIKNSNRGICG